MAAKYYTKDGYIADKGSKIINISKRGSTRILFATHGGKLVVQLVYYKPDTNRIVDYGDAYGVYKKFKWGQDKLIDWLSKTKDKNLLRTLNIKNKG